MNFRKLLKLLLVLGLTMSLLVPGSLEEKQLAGTEPLTLTLKSVNLSARKEQKEFLIGEPVKISLTLENTSGKEVKVLAGLKFGSGKMAAYIAAEDGPFEPYSSIGSVRASFANITVPVVTLKHGEQLKDTDFIYYDLVKDSFAFPEAKRYKLRMDYWYDPEDSTKKIASNIIEISVKAPESKADQEALQFIKENKLAPYLAPEGKGFPTSKEEHKQAKKKLRELRREFQASTYRRYATLSLVALCTEGTLLLLEDEECQGWYIELGEEVLPTLQAEGIFGKSGSFITLGRFQIGQEQGTSSFMEGRLAFFTKRVAGLGDRLLLYVLEPSTERGTILLGIREAEKLRLFTYRPGATVRELTSPQERRAFFLDGPLTLEQWGSGFDFEAGYTASQLLQVDEHRREALVFMLNPKMSELRRLAIGVEPIEWLLIGASREPPEWAAMELKYLERREAELPDEIFQPENLPSFDPARFGVR